jgi:alpha-beta hydrolase superfamily lysophospholipase
VTGSVTRVPLWFGPAGRPLFGWYHAPASANRRELAVVVCPPLGSEYFNSYRSLRHLADRLAENGVSALRFDYDGTGNSAGQDEDPGRESAWIESIHAAMARLRAESGIECLGLAGVRMGATLAALAAQDVDVSCLALWAPCVSGRDYVRELKAMDLTSASASAGGRDSPDLEAGGCVMTEETQREIARIDLRHAPPRAARILIARRDDRPERDLRDSWSAPGRRIDQQTLPGLAQMLDVPHHARVPDVAIDSIVRWIATEVGKAVTKAPDTGTGSPVPDALFGSVSESFVQFGEGGSLFGVLTEPADGAAKTTAIVLLSNAGATHHVGPGRLYVLLGRALSRAGFRCLRLDLPGLGDSDTGDAGREGEPYIPEATSVIATATDAVAHAGVAAPVIVMGLCSGAHTAFQAALQLDRRPVTEAVLINPLTFYYRPGMSLDEPATLPAGHWRRYASYLGSVHGWSKLLSVDLAVLRRVLRALGPSRASSSPGSAPGNSLTGDLERATSQGRALTFVFSRYDPGYDLLVSGAGRAVRRLARSGQIRLWFIDGANHTFDRRRPRAEMIASITSHLSQRYLR